MAGPVLVKSYSNSHTTTIAPRTLRRPTERPRALLPVSSYAFADILRAADCPELQQALDGIAEICAKNYLSLAGEHGAHIPPLGELTAVSTTSVKPHLIRRGRRPALTSVPEGSSGSSEESRRSKKKRRGSLFGFGWQKPVITQPMRKVRIGSLGRTVGVETTTALAADLGSPSSEDLSGVRTGNDASGRERSSSAAAASLQRLLEAG